MRFRLSLLFFVVSACAVLWNYNRSQLRSDTEDLTRADRHFTLRVWPLLEAKCIACHGADPSDLKGGLNLTSHNGLVRGGESGEPLIVPGDLDKSMLIDAIRRGSIAMPPKDEDRLTSDQIEVFEHWVLGGAAWPSEQEQLAIRRSAWQVPENEEGVLVRTSGGLSDDWTYRRYQRENLWAYQPLAKSELDLEGKNPVDVFIDQQLAAEGLAPAPRADPYTLIRRLTFDVIGLPPSPNEIKSFLEAWSVNSEQAWLEAVDQLLASPHYGEQAARHWLDVVRYADSAGFANDWQRPNAWRYRDYVVRSFNQDKPYDQFLREQLAGDELNAHDPEMKVAVGFLRMGPWEHSFMSVPKVSRQQYLDDLTDAVGQVFLAHPLQCARCHDHKFDPVPTRDFYALQAVFATTQLADIDAAWLPDENRLGMKEDQDAHRRKRAWNEARLAKFTARLAEEEEAWFRARNMPYKSRDEAIAAGLAPNLIPEYRVGLTPDELGGKRISQRWKLRYNWEQIRYEPIALSVYNGVTQLSKGVNKRTNVPTDPLQGRALDETTILLGGDPFSPAVKVSPGVLSVVNGGKQLVITEQAFGRRLALAEWLVESAQALTARVMVNRIWQSHFGQGIVGTPNNFGATGKKPTHPELLDFLAATFVNEGWSVKKIRRLILTSQAYQRSSNHHDIVQLNHTDPSRELYAAFQPRRLAAEELRDAMLAVSKELNPVLGGIPARPDMNLEAAMQPRLVMGSFAPAYVPHAQPSQRNRRSIYALKLRGLRDPFYEIFDQPSPDIACEQRMQSNVTPQVFSLLNGQESADRALALADRVIQDSDTNEEAIGQLYWLVYGREPMQEEVAEAFGHWQEMERVQSEIEYDPPNLPTRVVRRANEEHTGKIFEFVEPLFEYEDYVPDLQRYEVDARTHGLADVCLMMLNSNEFIYVY